MSLGPEWKLDVQKAEKERWATSHGWYRGGVGQRKKCLVQRLGRGICSASVLDCACGI